MPVILHFLILFGCHCLIISLFLFRLRVYLRLYSLRLGGCTNPVIHFTSVLARFNLQGGPQTPPDDPPEGAPVLRALPAPSPRRHTRSENPGPEQWPTGGAAAAGRGDGDGGAADAADEYRAEDIDDLFAAIERDTQ